MTKPDKWQLKEMKEALTATGRVLPAVREVVLRETIEDRDKRDTEYLHPSEICKKDWCPRASWYTILDRKRPAQSQAFSRMNVFAEGNAIHKKWQKWLAKAGILEGRWVCKDHSCGETHYGLSTDSEAQVCPYCGSDMRYAEVPIASGKYHIIGHADGIIADQIGKAVLEIKSVGTGTVKFDAPELFMPFAKGEYTLDQLWSKIRMPFPSHIRQVSLYMFLLGIHEAVIIYEWKPTQDVKEFKLRFREEHIAPILEGCLSVKQALETGKPVKRPVWATDEDMKTCAACPYRNRCWSIDEHQTSEADSDGEVSDEVRPAGSSEGGDSGNPRLGRVVRRRTDGVVS